SLHAVRVGLAQGSSRYLHIVQGGRRILLERSASQSGAGSQDDHHGCGHHGHRAASRTGTIWCSGESPWPSRRGISLAAGPGATPAASSAAAAGRAGGPVTTWRRKAMPSYRAMIAATGLRKSYGGKLVLGGIDLTLTEATTFALIGPNGAGGTTAVHI